MSRKDAVLDLLALVTGLDALALRPEMDLVADLGIDSPKALRLLVEIEERFALDIPDEDAARMSTVGHLLDYVEARA